MLERLQSFGEKLREAGVPVSNHEMLVAAQALSLGLTVVTNNTRHFSRVPGLAVENWV